jgi:hypothetical protein
MRTSCFAGAVVGVTVALGASAGMANQENIPLLQREGHMGPTSVTLTGCVAQGTLAGTYMLTTITPQAEATNIDSTKSTTLTLTGGEVDLSLHLGHKVSVTGVRAAHRATGAAEGAVKDDVKKTTGTFAVQSLKMIAASCSQPEE